MGVLLLTQSRNDSAEILGSEQHLWLLVKSHISRKVW